MGFFTSKKEVKLEDFCRSFYELIIHPKFGEIDTASYAEKIKQSITQEDSLFSNVDLKKLTDEYVILRFELFALAFTHKFISGENVLKMSAFTKSFLQEKQRMDIWEGMKKYNDQIDGCTLIWLYNLPGKFNMVFNSSMRDNLAKENIEKANKNEIGEDIIEGVNNRLSSEVVWKQKTIAGNMVVILCKEFNIDANKLNQEAKIGLISSIISCYNGAKEACGGIKIIN